MKLLLNEKEIANYLYSIVDHLESAKQIPFDKTNIKEVKEYIKVELAKDKFNLDKMRKKFKDKIHSAVERDMKNYVGNVKSHLKKRKKKIYTSLHTKLDTFLNAIGTDKVIENYRKSSKTGFVKGTGLTIDNSAQLVRRVTFTDYTAECLLRNTVGNEQLLITKIDNRIPFWFIDSGYTNFLETTKKWHRLVHNHIHVGKEFNAPVDRLGIFKTFPKQWRGDGDQILVIEPGKFAAGIFHVDINKWKYDVEAELRKYTNKKIVFREKEPKKTRPQLVTYLRDEDVHCVVNINSNAATEALWEGVPAITLGTHITNPVTRSRLCDVEHLLKPHLANWLCMLSYSQFTYEELTNGTAAGIIKQYHE